MKDLSIILTIFNKAEYLPYTLLVLCEELGQSGYEGELLCIDDASTDTSVSIIEKMQLRYPQRIRLIRNTENKGPSIRLNQAAQHAQGKYLLLIDADDMLRPGAISCCLAWMKEKGADLLYGGYQHSVSTIETLKPSPMLSYHNYAIIEHVNPLRRVVDHSYTRMRLMVSRELYVESGGADETIFIQDESLPLRLASRASCFIELKEAIINVPKSTGQHLSMNKDQQHHDRFFAYYNLLELLLSVHGNVSPILRYRIIRQIFASYWKSARIHQHGLKRIFAMLRYFYSKIPLPVLHARTVNTLQSHRHYMESIPNVRIVS